MHDLRFSILGAYLCLTIALMQHVPSVIGQTGEHCLQPLRDWTLWVLLVTLAIASI